MKIEIDNDSGNKLMRIIGNSYLPIYGLMGSLFLLTQSPLTVDAQQGHYRLQQGVDQLEQQQQIDQLQREQEQNALQQRLDRIQPEPGSVMGYDLQQRLNQSQLEGQQNQLREEQQLNQLRDQERLYQPGGESELNRLRSEEQLQELQQQQQIDLLRQQEQKLGE